MEAGLTGISLGLVFVFAYITLMVVTLRRSFPANLLFFAGAVVIVPHAVCGVFWVLQQMTADAAAYITAMGSFMVTAIGLPTCLMICIKHDVGTATKMIGIIR